VFARVFEPDIDFPIDLPKDILGNCDAIWLGQRLKTRRNIDPGAVYRTITFFDNVTQIDANAEQHPPLFPEQLVSIMQFLLDIHRCLDCPDSTWKYSKDAITCRIDNSPPAHGDAFLKHGSVVIQRSHRVALVCLHQP
jgi:hypothetical protein